MEAQSLVHGHWEAVSLKARVGKRGLQGGARRFEPPLLGAPLGEDGLQLGWRRRPAGATCSLCVHRGADEVVAVRVEGAKFLRTEAHHRLCEAAVDCGGGAHLHGAWSAAEGAEGAGGAKAVLQERAHGGARRRKKAHEAARGWGRRGRAARGGILAVARTTSAPTTMLKQRYAAKYHLCCDCSSKEKSTTIVGVRLHTVQR